MVNIIDNSGVAHTIRGASKQFHMVLSAWKRICPDDLFYCSAHGRYEPIAILAPETVKEIPDRVAEQQAICGDLEAQDREKFAKDLERAQRRK